MSAFSEIGKVQYVCVVSEESEYFWSLLRHFVEFGKFYILSILLLKNMGSGVLYSWIIGKLSPVLTNHKHTLCGSATTEGIEYPIPSWTPNLSFDHKALMAQKAKFYLPAAAHSLLTSCHHCWGCEKFVEC